MSETSSRIVLAISKTPVISDWDRHRDLIMKLYLEEGKTLVEVKAILYKQHGFDATIRQYKDRLRIWGVRKNLHSEDIEALLRRYTKEELQNALGNGHDSSLMLQGRVLSRAAVLRQLRRLRLTQDPADELAKSLTWSRPNSCISASPGPPPRRAAQHKRAHICTSTGCQLTEIGFTTIDELEQHQKAVHGLDTGLDSCDESTALEGNSTLRSDSQISTPAASTSVPKYQSCQDSASLGHSSVNASHLRNEQHTTEEDTNEGDEEGSDARRKRRKIRFGSPLETKALACPFHKYDPRRYNPQNENIDSAMRYRTCAGPGWESISRLRQHLFRAHVPPTFFCRACNLALHSQLDFEKHVRDRHAGVPLNMISTSKTISKEQQDQLKQKQLPNLTKEESWVRMYRVLFPHDSSVPSPYYQRNDERLPDETFASFMLGQPIFQIQQIDSLVLHLCKTLPEKVAARWQGPSEPRSFHPNFIETLDETAFEPTGDIHSQSSQAQTAARARIHGSTSPLASATFQKLKQLISEGVLETCTEWLKTCNKEDLGSDLEEDSEDENENEQPWFNSTLADLSLAPVTTVPDQWTWYADQQSTSTLFPELSIPPPNPPRTNPYQATWASLPPFGLLPTHDNHFSSASATPCGPEYMEPLSTQSIDSALVAQRSHLDSTLIATQDGLDSWEIWGHSARPGQMDTTLPELPELPELPKEANQDP